MGVKKSATFTDEEYREAALVAEYQNRTFARFIVHCVNIEVRRRLDDARAWKSKETGGTLSVAGKPPQSQK
jgi:uncharacterized protein YaiE (UPF0345 family)